MGKFVGINLGIMLSFLLFISSASAASLLVSNMNLGATSITYDQNTTVNMVISGGFGPYTANIFWCKGGNGPCAVPSGALSNTVPALLPTSGNFFSFTVNAFSYNTLQVTFNSVTYTISTPAIITTNVLSATNFMSPNNAVFANTIYGPWLFNGVISDAGANTISVATQPNSIPFININPAAPVLDFLAPAGFLAFITNYGNNTLEMVNVNPSNIPASNVTNYMPVGLGPTSLVSPPGQMSASAPTIVGTVDSNANTVSVINVAVKEVMTNMSLGVGSNPVAVASASNGIGFGGMAFADFGTSNVAIILPPSQQSRGFTVFNISLAGKVVGPDAMDTYFNRTGSSTLWVAGKTNGNVVAINLTSLQPGNAISLGPNAQPDGVAASPFGFVYVADYGTNTISVINASSLHPGVIANITGVGALALNGPKSITVDYSSPKLYVTNYNTNTISVVDGMAFKVLNTYVVNSLPVSNPNYVSLSPNGKLLYVSNFGANVISVLRTSDFSVQGTLPANEPTGVTLFSNYFYNGTAPANVNFEVVSPGNQLTASLSIMDRPGNFLPTGQSTTNVLSYSPGVASNRSFQFMFQTQGNANYFPSLISKGFDIMPSFPQQVKLSLTLANGTTIIVSKQNQTISLSGNPTALFPMTLTANIITFNNQLQGNVFLDGTTVNSLNFGFSKTFTTLTAGLESFILNSTGDGNYMPVDPSIDLTVLSPTTTVSSGCTGGCVRGSGGTGVTYTTSPSTSVATTTTPPTTTMPAAINGSFHASYNLTATSPLAINASNLGISLTIGSSSSSEASVIISNDTNSSPSAPSGFSKLLTANISISTQANISTNVTLHYPCSVNSSRVAPYKLVNGSWKRISQFQLDSNSCAITFSITKDPIVGLFQNTTHTTTIATTSPSTMPTTITTQSNNTSAQQSSSGTSSTLLIVVVVIVIIIIAVYLLKGRK